MVGGLYGYHTKKIKKGKLGTISKIQEELDELQDAEDQGVKILIACELADLYGALRDYAEKQGLQMEDLRDMVNLTKAAFEGGYR
jgi:phosphoribosyl-ATP pyrophosphohydrolase